MAAAQQTAQGRARLALVAALGDTPGWFTPLSPEPSATDYTAQEANQFLWDTQVTFPFVFAFRADLQARAGGNPSWNTGVNYFSNLAKSVDVKEVAALYRSAGLSLGRDVQKLNSSGRIKADPKAVAYLASNIAFNGDISVPVLTMHTTGDGLVVPENAGQVPAALRPVPAVQVRKVQGLFIPNGPCFAPRSRRPATRPRPPRSGCRGDPGRRARSPRRCSASPRSRTARRGGRTGPG